MAIYPVPLNERERSEELHQYAILDTPPEECFDQLTHLAAYICDVPIALISFVDRDRVWFKSRVGLKESQVRRDQAFCAYTVLGPDIFVVQDAASDCRFAQSELVTGESGARFYAGVPLLTPHDVVLGSLCIIDRRPSLLSVHQVRMLKMLATQLGQHLESRRTAAILRRQSKLLEETQRTAQIGGWELDIRTRSLSWADETYRIHGVAPPSHVLTLDSAMEWYTPASRPIVRAALDTLMSGGSGFDLEAQIATKDGVPRWIRMTGQRENAGSKLRRIAGFVQDITRRRELEAEILLIAQREQNRIGSNLHDGLGQELTGVAFLLHALASKVPATAADLQADLNQIEGLVRDAIGSCRSLAEELSPKGWEGGGLIEALQRLGSRIEQIHGVRVVLRTRGANHAFDPFVAEHLYRIAQEATTNALKHAHARRIVVHVDVTPVRTRISITDDGIGRVGAVYEGGMGLQIMRYRARLIGAAVTIKSTAAGGTRVSCRVAAKSSALLAVRR